MKLSNESKILFIFIFLFFFVVPGGLSINPLINKFYNKDKLQN